MDSIEFVDYKDESMIKDIQTLVSKDLSEPYSIFTYRYFLHNWPELCICAYDNSSNNSNNSTSSDAIVGTAISNSNKDSCSDQFVKRKMIATIVCKLEGPDDYKQGYIAMLTVDKSYRKKGIAMKLVTSGIERMIRMGCAEVVLETEVS